MLRRLGNVLFAIVLGSGAANAQVTFNKGYDLLSYCTTANDALTGRGVPSRDAQQANGEGFCMGIIVGVRSVVTSSIMDPKFRLCIPNDVSNGQALSVVVNYMHNHPDQLSQTFTIVALSALVDTWRCK